MHKDDRDTMSYDLLVFGLNIKVVQSLTDNETDAVWRVLKRYKEVPIPTLPDKKLDSSCNHEKTEYQAYEPDTNVLESYSCVDCGAELDIPEPDWDALNKE